MQRVWNLLGYSENVITFNLQVESDVLEEAVKRGDEVLIKAALTHKSNPINYDNQKLLKLSIEKKQVEIFKLFLADRRFSLSKENDQFLKMIFETNDDRFIELSLKQADINPSFEDNYALRSLHLKNKPTAINILLEHPKFICSETVANLIKKYKPESPKTS